MKTAPAFSPDTGDMAALQAAEARIIADFSFFQDWEDKYAYLVELGDKLPPFPESEKREENRLKGCQAQVWFISRLEDGRLVFEATSDAVLVRGLIALILKIFSNRLPGTILAAKPSFVEALGLSRHLSPTRANGLAAMLQAIRNMAGRTLENRC